MKKNTESQYFSKSGLRSKKQVSAMNRKARNPQLESLEERQLLSAVSMLAAENGIQAETFYVTLNNVKNDSDTSTQYIAMHVQGNVDASDITVADKNGAKQQILNSVTEDGVTTLLLRMGLGSDYTVTVNGVSKDNQISVLFTTPSDTIDGDGAVGFTEYYSAFGNVLKGQGISQRTAMMFQQQYGINISTLEFNKLLDLNGNGVLSQDEFNTLVKGTYDAGLKIDQTIIVKPTVEDLKVNGTDATLTDEEKQEYAVNQNGGEVVVSGKLPPNGNMTIVGEVTFTDAEGNEQTVSIPDMYQDQNSDNHTYDVDENGNFTLTLKGVQDNSKITVTMSYAGTESSENTFTINLDTNAPTLVPGTLTLTSSNTVYDGKTYTTDNMPSFSVSTTGINQADYDKIVSEINSTSEGIWVVLEYSVNGQTQKLEYKLSGSEFKKNEETGTYDFSHVFTIPKLVDGVYSFTTYTRDVAGNPTDAKTQEITIDTTRPEISAPGFLADYKGTMYVDEAKQTLTLVVKDANMKVPAETNPTVTLNGKTLAYTSATAVDGGVEYVFENFTLSYGENTVEFDISDIVGNHFSAIYKYTFNQVPQIADAGQKLDGANRFVSNSTGDVYEYTVGNIADLFNETDGSKILAENVDVQIKDVDGKAVTSWKINENGDLILILDACAKEEIVEYVSHVTITYTDEHDKKAFYTNGDATREAIELNVTVTNNTVPPRVTFDNAGSFTGKIDTSSLVVAGTSADITLTLNSGLTETVSAVATITYVSGGETKTETVDFVALEKTQETVTLTGLDDGSEITITYMSEDIFGNKTETAESLGTILVDTTLAGEIKDFLPTVATPSNKPPMLNFDVTNAGVEAMHGEIIYTGTTATGEIVSGTFKAEFVITGDGKFTGQTGAPLADGTYTFTLTIWDNAGHETSATIEDYVVDTTAPTAEITNTDTKTENEKYTLNFAYPDNDLSGVKKLYLNGEEITLGKSYEVTLNYGENTFTLIAEDAAGNKSEVSNSFTIIYNKKPVANTENTGYDAESSTVDKAVFDQLLSVGFKETSGDYVGKIVLDLADYITDEKLTQFGTPVLTNNNAIKSAEIVDGKLILDMEEVLLGNDLSAMLNVTLTDEFGETIELQLNIKYIFDNEAPTVKPGNLTVTGNSAYETGKFAIKDGNFTFNATITDDTAIVSAAWVLVGPDGNIIIRGEGNITDTKTATATGTATLTEEGVYTLKFWGDDGITEASTEAEPSVSYSITFDKTVPTFTGSVTLKNDATPTKETSQTFNIGVTVTDASDCWLVIYDNGTEVKTVKAENGVFPTEVTVDNLADGAHAFTYEIIDAASNNTATATIGSITVDTVAPTINGIKLVGDKLIVENSGSTTLNNVKFNFDIEDESNVTKFYSTDDGKTWTEYKDADGVKGLAFGDTKFQFKVEDKAGNVTVWEDSITVSYDHSPVLVEGATLKDNSFAYPTDGNTVTVTYTKAEIAALFNDDDKNHGDELVYTFDFTDSEAIELTKAELVGDNWELTFTLNDKDAVRKLHEVGTLTVTLTDKYGEKAETSATIFKANLPVEQKKDSVSDTQKVEENPSYTWNLSEYFSDPESDDWSITSATVNGETATADGKNVTWTPASGKYGNTTMTVKVTDAKGAEATFEIAVTIDWAGITSVSAEKLTVAENAGAQTITVTAENLFDVNQAWGDYTATVNWNVAVTNQNVSGNTVTTTDGNRTQTQCTSLFVGEPTIADGEISFTLAENAYGNATLTFSANGVENTVVVEVKNTEVVPYTKPNLGYFPVNDESASIPQSSIIAGCDTDTDSGNVAFVSMTLKETDTVKSTTVDGKNAINITKDGATYCVLMEEDGTNVKFTLYSVTKDNTTTLYANADSTVWEALDGVEIAFTYTVKNDSTDQTATNTYTLQFSAAAHSVTKTVERAQESQKVTILYSELCSEAGATIGAVNGLPEGYMYIVTDAGNIEITIPAYARGTYDLSYSLTLNGETFSAHIYLNITDVNWAPTWAENVETDVNNAFQWKAEESDNAYELTLRDKIADVNNDTKFDDLTIIVKEGYTVTDARKDYNTKGTVTYDNVNGKLVFTPADPNFYGTVTVTLTVTDTAVGTAVAKSTDFQFVLTVNNVNDAPVHAEGVTDSDFVISAKPGEVLELQKLFGDKFTDVDGDTITIVNNKEATKHIAPTTMGIHTFVILAKDGNGLFCEQTVTVAVAGSTTIEDLSLDAFVDGKDTYPAGTALSNNLTLPTDVTLTSTATLAVGTVLKAGTVLAAGSKFFGMTGITCEILPDEFVNTFSPQEGGGYATMSAYTLAEDVVLPSDMTIMMAMNKPTLAAGSVIKAESTYAAGSTPGVDIEIKKEVANLDTIMKIYMSTREPTDVAKGADAIVHDVLIGHKLNLPTETIAKLQAIATDKEILVFNDAAINDRETRTITVYAEAEAESDSPFRYIGYDEVNGFMVYYRPYDVMQDRSEQTMQLKIQGSDATLDVDVSINYETVFEWVQGVVAGDQRESVVGPEEVEFVTNFTVGETYTYKVWLKCNLPMFSTTHREDFSSTELWWKATFYDALTLKVAANLKFSGISDLAVIEESKVTANHLDNVNYEAGTADLYRLLITEKTMGVGEPYTNEYFATSVSFKATSADVKIEADVTQSTMSVIFDNDSKYGQNYPGIGVLGLKKDEAGNIIDNSTAIDGSQFIQITPNPIKGTTANRETVVEGNGVYMSVVKEKSDVETSETFRESEAYITEWDSSWVELWVNTQEAGTEITKFNLDLFYNTNYFTATDFEYSANVANGNAVTLNDVNGKVAGISGDLTNAVTNEDGFVLIGRVKLDSVGTDNVAADTLNSASLGLQLANVLLYDSNYSLLNVNDKVYANTKVFASVYDANDDGIVDIKDLVMFARMFDMNSIDTTDPRVWAMDFNNSGKVDIKDLVSFARNYGASRDGDKQVEYPINFFQTWIGTTLDVNGDSNVADTLNDAILSWSEKLGEELNIDVQIIVTEYENVEGGCLAETILLGCDEDGKPNTAVVYLDSDALGMGWYAGKSDNVINDQYDLYSVLLHELGHALGMSPSYDGYNSLIDSTTSTYTDENGNVHYIYNGHVVTEGDLMNDMIGTGVRHEISDLDAEIVANARKEGGNVYGFIPNAVSGTVACTLGSEVQNDVLITTATGMMAEENWNAMLVDSATKAVEQAAITANEQVYDELYPTEEGASLNLATTVSAVSLDDLFDDDDFARELEEIAQETLRIQLNDQE